MINATGFNDEYAYNPYGAYNRHTYSSKEQESIFLEQKLENIKDEQGILGKAWNGIKEITTLGISASDCDSVLEKYKNGEISFEEAVGYFDEFDTKQENASGLLSNILTGIGGIAVATAAAASGPIGWGLAFLKGAPIGAVLKTGINLLDRATNDIDGDALDVKQMTKDAVSGAITGAASAVSGASSLGYKALEQKGLLSAGTIGADIAKGVFCGAECGAMAGAATYMTDVALGDKDFEFGELLTNSATSALVSGSVGAVVGAGFNGLAKTDFNNLATVTKDSISSSTRKILGVETKDFLGIS